jgi:hypothetical protein
MIHQSFQIEMNQVIWDFWPYKSNPRYKSFEKSSTNWIHDTKLLKKVLRIESAIKIFKVWIHESGFASPPARIRKDLFCATVLRICQDWWGFIGFVKTGRIFLKISLRIKSTNWIFNDGTQESRFANLWSMICQSQNETNLFGVRIHDHDTKQIHVFTNILYNSCILIKYTMCKSLIMKCCSERRL